MSNEKNLTPELLEKAKYATSAATLLTLAQENGISLTAEEAANYYSQLHPEIGALSDEELDNVSGGGLCGPAPKRGTLTNPYTCPNCKSTLTIFTDPDFKCYICCKTGKLIGDEIILLD